MDKDIVKAIRNWCNGRFAKKEDTKALDDKITSQNADFAKSLDQISSDLAKSNLLNAHYDPGVAGDIDPHISDLAFIRANGSSIFGHSTKLNSIGYWIDVLTISNRMYNQASQIAIGENGVATRSLSHESNKWSEWHIL